MIDTGEKAPEFEVRAWDPEEERVRMFNLRELRGKWVIMTFHPGDFTFVCATDLEGFAKRYDDFSDNNAEVLAISTDTVFSHKMWHETSPKVQTVQYPMLEDINKDISRVYGFLGDNGMTKRGVVILDPDGVVQYVSVFNENLGKDVDHVYRSFMGLKELRESDQDEEEFDVIPSDWEPGEEPMHISVPEDIGRL